MNRERGVTLVELIASIVIIAVAVVGLMAAVTAATARSADPLIASQAHAIAQGYLDEIAQTNFCDPAYDPDGDPATGCRTECTASVCAAGCGGALFGAEPTRAEFDDICDYHGLHQHGAFDRVGRALAGLEQYEIQVEVVDAGITLGAPALLSNNGQVARIDVSVDHPGLEQPILLGRFKANVP